MVGRPRGGQTTATMSNRTAGRFPRNRVSVLEPPFLPRIDLLLGRDMLPPAGLDLDEDQDVPVPADQVDLAAAAGPVSRQDAHPLPFQELGRLPLATGPQPIGWRGRGQPAGEAFEGHGRRDEGGGMKQNQKRYIPETSPWCRLARPKRAV